MDPATAKECKGPCLYWCKSKSTALPFLLGVAVGAFLMQFVVPLLVPVEREDEARRGGRKKQRF